MERETEGEEVEVEDGNPEDRQTTGSSTQATIFFGALPQAHAAKCRLMNALSVRQV